MHEVHLVRAIVEAVEKKATAQKAKRVKSLKVRFNALTSHSADHVKFAFELVKKDSPLLKKARLKLNEVEPLLVCNQCGEKFLGHHLPDICPKCGSIDVKAVNSTDLVLESFEIEK
jgi:hydrogenase nickel incorporation protein HypA/HybF